MKQTRVLVVLSLATVIIVGCSPSESGAEVGQRSSTRALASTPSQADVDGKGPIEALSLANMWMGNGVTTHVTTESVNFEFPGGGTAAVDLPVDKMVVAIAPYIDNTHPCEIHYMSGCQGELVGVPIDVVATLSNGSVVVDETYVTMANGFIELWLPRDHEVALTLAAKGKSVDGTIETFANSNTCITTLRLM